jgi:O-antigen/teichoic acid export membrane protein
VVTQKDEAGHAGDVSNLARGGALNLFGAFVFALGGMVLYVILARGFDKATAGSFIQTIAIFNILAIVGAMGSDTGLVWAVSRAIAQGRGAEIRRFVRIAVVPVAALGVVFGALIWAGADTIAATFGGDESKDTIRDLLRVMAPVIPIASVFLALLGATRGYNTMVPTVALNRVGRAVIQPTTAAVVVVVGASITALAVGWVAPFVIGIGFAAAWLSRLNRRNRGPSAEPRPVRDLVSQFWRFTLPRALASIFRVGVQWIDVLIVGYFMTPADAAAYAVATRLLQIGLFVAASVGQVAQPMFAGLLAGGHVDRARHVFQTATGWQVAITWPFYLIAWMFAGLLLELLFGADFVDAAPVVAILAVSGMAGAAAGPVDMLLLMAGKSTWSLWNTAATLTVNVVLNLVLIPEYGIVGAAISWAISRLVANALPLGEVVSYLKLHPFGRATLIAAAGALAVFGGLGLVTWLIDDHHLGWFIGYLAVATSVYGLFLHRVRDALELPLAIESFRRRRSRKSAVASGATT